MGRTLSYKADGSSKVVQYVSFTGWVGQSLEIWLNRDAEAIRLLTDPALPEAQRREEKRYWNRRFNARRLEVGEKPRSESRIWTRRDEKRVNWLVGNFAGWIPQSRTSRFLARISGQGDQLFQLAFSEATENGTVSIIGGSLNDLRATYERLINISNQLTEFDSDLSIFDGVHSELGQCQVKLFPFLPAPKKSAANEVGDSLESAIKKKKVKSKNSHETEKAKHGPWTNSELKIIAALTEHHGYSNGVCMTHEKIGSNKLAVKAECSTGKVSEFWKKAFEDPAGSKNGEYSHYENICKDKERLNHAIKMLNGELTPGVLRQSLRD